MIRFAFNVLVIVFAFVPASFAGDLSPAATQPAANPKPIAIFDRLMGSWLGEHKGTGESFQSRVIYEAGIADQILKGKSFTMNAKGDTKLRYETFCFYHPGEKALKFISVGSTGGIFDGRVIGNRDEMVFEWTAYLKDQRVDYKQTIRFINDDKYQWTVLQKGPEGWKQVIDGSFIREAAPRTDAAK